MQSENKRIVGRHAYLPLQRKRAVETANQLRIDGCQDFSGLHRGPDAKGKDENNIAG